MNTEERIAITAQGPKVLHVGRADMLALLRLVQAAEASVAASAQRVLAQPDVLTGVGELVRRYRDALNRAVRAEARIVVLEEELHVARAAQHGAQVLPPPTLE